MIGEDKGSAVGFLDVDDRMIHATLGNMFGGAGINYVTVGTEFNLKTLKHDIHILSAEK